MSEQSAERAPAAAVAAQRTPVKRATESNRTDVGKPVSTGRAAATFEPVGRSVASARGFVRDTLQGWALGEVVDDAVVLTSELVTNAVVHAGTSAEVLCLRDDSGVRIEVVDHYPDRELPVQEGGLAQVSPEREGGRGLLQRTVERARDMLDGDAAYLLLATDDETELEDRKSVV
jgi:hypothetical protein